MSTLLLEIVHLDVTFGSIAAVRDLSFSIATGESLGLVGESGSGKSVTSLAIMRLLPPQARIGGTIRFAGEDMLPAISERTRQLRGRAISIHFQEPMTDLNTLLRIVYQVTTYINGHDNVIIWVTD